MAVVLAIQTTRIDSDLDVRDRVYSHVDVIEGGGDPDADLSRERIWTKR